MCIVNGRTEKEIGRGRELREGYFVRPKVKWSGVEEKRTERQGRSREREKNSLCTYQ